jgi:chromosomal replication initiation ATPase DnaA
MTISLTHPLLPLMSVFEHALTQKPGTSQALTLRPTPKNNALRAQKVGGDMQERRVISILEVQAAVARIFHLSRAELLSRSRRQHIAHARQIAMYLSRELAGRTGRRSTDSAGAIRKPTASFPRIGIAFNRDHSSVIHACNRIARRRLGDAELASLLDSLAQSVSSADQPAIPLREGQ